MSYDPDDWSSSDWMREEQTYHEWVEYYQGLISDNAESDEPFPA
jgi:hypothetical protein